LNSERAIEVNITIMRAFVRLHEALATHKDLAHKLSELEAHLKDHDQQIQVNWKLPHPKWRFGCHGVGC